MKRLSLSVCVGVVFLAFTASPAAAECYDECTYSVPCDTYCEICGWERYDVGCVWWIPRTCGDYQICSGFLESASHSACSSQPNFEQFLPTGMPTASASLNDTN